MSNAAHHVFRRIRSNSRSKVLAETMASFQEETVASRGRSVSTLAGLKSMGKTLSFSCSACGEVWVPSIDTLIAEHGADTALTAVSAQSRCQGSGCDGRDISTSLA